MRLWLEAQSIPVIALVVFGLSYLMAATAFLLARVAARLGWAHDFKHIPAMTLMPLAVLLAVLLGFLASRVWANHEHAENYVAQEASALHEIVLMAPAFPADVQTRLHAAVRAHIKAMAEEEWPAMARGEKDMGRTPRVLAEATAMVLDLNPLRPGEQQLAQQRVVAALDQALDARRNRIMLSGELIDGVQWGVILVLMILILATVAMGYVESPRASAIGLFVVATASAARLVLLLAYDQPLNAGGFFVQPTLLRDIFTD
jgi:hypothetical protein